MQTPNRLRGMFGLAVTCGVALSALATGALVLGLATGVVPQSVFGMPEVISVAVRGLLVGAVGGGLFAALVSMRERQQTVATISSKRTALWGFLAGASALAIVSVTAGAGVLPVSVLAAGTLAWGVGGALAGIGLLRMARRAPQDVLSAADDTTRLTR